MIFVDTGCFHALVNPVDAWHRRAKQWIPALREGFITTEYVLIETFNAFSASSWRDRCHSIVRSFLTRSDVEIVWSDLELFQEGLSFHREMSDKEWSLVDCLTFLLMRSRNISLALAHDHHFTQAGFDALLRRDPR